MKTVKFMRHGFGRWPPVLLLVTIVLVACSKPDAQDSAGSNPQVSSSGDSSHTPSRGMVRVDPKVQALLQLKTEALVTVEVTPALRTYGRVLDPAPLAVLVNEWVSAQAALTASEKEQVRITLLLEQNNASARAAQAAEAAAARDRALVQSVRDRIALTWGTALSHRPDLPALVQRLTTLASVMVRIDVPLGEQLSEPSSTARVVPVSEETRSTDADFLSLAPATDPQLQGQGLLYLTKTNTLHLTPEAAVIGYLAQRGAPLRGVRLPRSALIRQDAQSWVYVQRDEGSFERMPAPTTHPMEGGWLITTGLNAGDRVVTDGAQILLSEELKSQVHLTE